jgi:uncharacterized repeat protein (TIGR01451 family)
MKRDSTFLHRVVLKTYRSIAVYDVLQQYLPDAPRRMILLVRLLLLLALVSGLAASVGLGLADAAIPPLPESDALAAARDRAYAAGFDLLPAGDAAWPPRLDRLPLANAQAAGLEAGAQAAGWQQLIFQSYRDGNWEVYTSDGDGLDQRRLTVNQAVDVRPRLSADMTRIAFVSNRDGNYDVYSMRGDGTDVRRLTTHGDRDDYPAWSPDGRRIAFSYLKGGNFELYVMNADGTGQTRLTFGGDDDIMPAWSPDGRKIAWAAVRNDGYGNLMMADANGANARSVTGWLKYLQHPVWSRDGTQIAFDYDADNDFWNELAVVQADGSGRRTIYDAGTNLVDVWMGAWSPNGSSIVATLAIYTIQGNNLVLAASGLIRVPTEGGTAVALPGAGVDMLPDWQPADLAAPTASLQPLPAVSSSPIVVRWSGADVGPAGVGSYDVQVRTGPDAAWNDWLTETAATTGRYSGLGGQTYQFRVRARDRAGNVAAWPTGSGATTTVETLPPTSTIGPLPPFFRSGGLVQFIGSDAGGSGIASYDGEARDLAGGDWGSFATGVTGDTAPFWGTATHSYALRARATDNAGNQEPVHTGAGDAFTTLYTWAARGTVRDNRDRPVEGTAITTTPPYFAGGTSDAAGAYAAYVSDWVDNYQVLWSKRGYGDLPPTTYPRAEDARIDVTLPPADNVVAGWGFERGSLGPEWTATGDASPSATAEAAHTGGFGARLGYVPFLAARQTIPAPGSPANPRLARDSSGALHLVWEDVGEITRAIYYARRSPDGAWSASRKISDDLFAINSRVAVASDGAVHVTWTSGSLSSPNQVYYAWRAANGVWSGPTAVGDGDDSWIGVGTDGTVHLMYAVPGQWITVYRRRSPAGSWSAAETVANSYLRVKFTVDRTGAVHVFWTGEVGGNYAPFYARRSAAGGWSTPIQLTQVGYYYSFFSKPVVSPDDRVHLLTWGLDAGPIWRLFHLVRAGDGRWQRSELAAAYSIYAGELAVDGQGRAHAVWGQDSWGDLYYRRGNAAEEWGVPIKLTAGMRSPEWNEEAAQIAVDAAGQAHVVWAENNYEIHYRRQEADDSWRAAENVSHTPAANSDKPRLVTAPNGTPQIVWLEGDSDDVAYADPNAPRTTDARISQTLVVPADMAGPTLSFFYRARGNLNSTNRFDVQIGDGGSWTTLFSGTAATGNWAHRWADLAAWAGRTVQIAFNVRQTAGQRAGWIDLDEVTVGAGLHADLWAAARSELAAPGEAVTLTVRYGNRGEAAVPAAALTLTLPTGLTFVSADPPSLTPAPTLSWQTAALPAGSTAAVTVTATVPGETPAGTLLSGDLAIGQVPGELEPDNNTAAVYVFVGGQQTYLPLAP